MKKLSLIFLFQLLVLSVYPKEKDGVESFKTVDKIINDLCYTDHGGAIAIADNNSISIYDITTEKLIREFKNGHHRRILTIDISRDSTILASGGKDSTILLWDLQSGDIIRTLKFQKGTVTSLKISPDKHYLISGGTDDRVFIYDITNDKITGEFNDHTNDITSVTISPDGRLAAGAGGDGLITIYDISNAKLSGTIKAHSDWIRAVAFNNDGSRLLSCGDESRLITWNISDLNNIFIASQKEFGNSWLLCLDYESRQDAVMYGNLSGRVGIRFSFGNYNTKLGVPVNKVKFRPNLTDTFEIAVATRGKGVMIINADEMKYKK